jgi:lipopolysaccharide assembly protein A
MRIFFYVLLILIVLFGVSFAALNAEYVTFHYYIGVKRLPLSFLLAFSLTVGVLLGWLLSFSMFLHAKRKIFTLKNKLKHVSDHQ